MVKWEGGIKTTKISVELSNFAKKGKQKKRLGSQKL